MRPEKNTGEGFSVEAAEQIGAIARSTYDDARTLEGMIVRPATCSSSRRWPPRASLVIVMVLPNLRVSYRLLRSEPLLGKFRPCRQPGSKQN
jgi:hypothetical protein